MYDFEPTDEQQMLIDWVKRFSASDLRPAAREAEEGGQFSKSLIEKGWELGIFQASIPEIFGGFGERSAVTGVLAAEEMAWGDVAGAMAIQTPSLFAMPILLVGSEAQKAKYLPDMVESNWGGYTAAFIEPFFDFDPFILRTNARTKGENFEITGTKSMVPYGGDAEQYLVYANLEGKTQGFIVPKSTEGITIKSRDKLLGLNGLPVYTVEFESVKIPKENLLGCESGHDFNIIVDALRVANASIAVGLSRAALEYAIDYAKERDVFGVKVAQKQAIAFMLAEMATEIEAIRLLTWEAAWMIDEGKPGASKNAYLAYTGAVDMAMMVTDRAVQVLGGHGYIREHPVELWMRNGRGIAMFTGLTIV